MIEFNLYIHKLNEPHTAGEWNLCLSLIVIIVPSLEADFLVK